MKIVDSKAKLVWDIFRNISDIPRKSKEEDKIINWLKTWAEKNTFIYELDSVQNVLIKVSASKGYENRPSICLQAHMDMVCEKTPRSTHDFSKDPIGFIEKDGYLFANDTTLGADNGIGMALGMALAIDPKVKHPELELLFTVDEETGLTGATGLQENSLKSKILINLDSEDDGVFTIGCAGGNQGDIKIKMSHEVMSNNDKLMELNVSCLRGGHSGVNINEQRASAIKILCSTIKEMDHKYQIKVVDLQGGSAHNAIPRDARAIIAINDNDRKNLEEVVSDKLTMFKSVYQKSDPDLKIELVKSQRDDLKTCLKRGLFRKLIDLLITIPHGVWRTCHEDRLLVETSSNVASIDIDENNVHIVTSHRSSNPYGLKELVEVIKTCSQFAGFNIAISGGYPSWIPNYDSQFLKYCIGIHKKVFNKEPILEVIHAGLECGIIGSKNSGMEMISFGPTIKNPHSPEECLDVQTVDKCWELLKKIVMDIK